MSYVRGGLDSDVYAYGSGEGRIYLHVSHSRLSLPKMGLPRFVDKFDEKEWSRRYYNMTHVHTGATFIVKDERALKRKLLYLRGFRIKVPQWAIDALPRPKRRQPYRRKCGPQRRDDW